MVSVSVSGVHELAVAAGDFRSVPASDEPSNLVIEAGPGGGEIGAESGHEHADSALLSFNFSTIVTVQLIGLVLRGRVEVAGAFTTLEIRSCTLTSTLQSSHDHSALRVFGGRVELHDTNVTGLRESALVLQGGETFVWRSAFTFNSATENGGVAHVTHSILNLFESELSDNVAVEKGGAIYCGPGGSVLFLNQSSLTRNRANEGNTIFVHTLAVAVSYSLPAPLASWISAPFVCGPSAVQPCDYAGNPLALGLTLFTFPSNGFEDDYPYVWSALPLQP